MADSAQTTGLKWVASATPSTQAFGDAAAVGTADTFTRGDHKHAMPADPVTQEAPSAFSYNSGWADVGSGWQAGRYWKDPFGNVHLARLITRTNLATMTIATLPAGYRPSATLQFLVDRDGVDGFMNLASTGTLVIGGADATIGGLSLSGITFRAA
jgi:hypothetical protein